MEQKPMALLREAMEGVQSVALGGHIRPDGDCVGSCLGMYHYLRNRYEHIKADVFLEEPPEVFGILEGSEHMHREASDEVYDLFIVLDCGTLDRLGFSKPVFQRAKRTLCIDHHIRSGDFADLNYIVEDAGSTAELVYDMLDRDCIDAAVATCLFIGIVHDTGVFRYSNTAPATLEKAAHLLSFGIDGSRLIENTFYVKTYAQNRILGKALIDSRRCVDQRMIYTILRASDLAAYEVTNRDLEGIVSRLRDTKGVDLALFMYEIGPGEFKCSLRTSSAVKANELAGAFGGGGHEKAAGFSCDLPAEQIVERVQALLEERLGL